MAPAQFIAQVRIREAARLLTSTSLSMEDIAERTGFPNPAYFSRVFKRITGRTPTQSRRESHELRLPEAAKLTGLQHRGGTRRGPARKRF